MKTKRKVMGVGINDADYVVVKFEAIGNKKKQVWICPYYQAWKTMLKRCFYAKDKEIRPTYIGATACEDWKLFTKFRAWMQNQIWEHEGQKLHLDKDVLSADNKLYSPETCRFVPVYINSLFTLRDNQRGEFPLGVHKQDNKYIASVTTKLFNGYLGIYSTPQEAHKAWQLGKAKVIQLTVDKYRLEPFYDFDVEVALLKRISKLLFDYNASLETMTL